jgi:polysaccharide chain length determinant protein (PEP-CTERM system associated)
MKKTKDIITPDQIIEIVLRRRWYIILPFIVSMIAGIFYTTTLTKIYEARTLILIQAQRVPENYVQAIVDSDTSSRINTLSQQIMSRTNLEKIIKDFRLFDDPNYENVFMEEKIEILRKKISIDITQDRRGADAFSITFQGTEPEKVMKVANGLAAYFIDENLKARESQAFGTSDFLEDELNGMRLKLEEVEETLKQYRTRYMGELPEQLETNLRILDRLQEQLNDRQQALREEKARLSLIENQIQNSQEQGVTRIAGAGVAPALPSDLDQLKQQLADLKTRYTAKHPDVLNLEKKIMELESNQTKAAEVQEQDVPIEQVERVNPLIAEYMQQRVEAQRDIQILEEEIAETTAQSKFYQGRVENTPKREQELLGLRRDYQNILTSYNSLLSRKLESDISVNMEKKQKGEQFRIVDHAQLPEKPINADMKKLFVLFIGAGLGIGGGIIFLLEYLDTSFRKPEDLESLLELPVLCTVPRLIHAREKKMRMVNQVFSVLFTGLSFVLLTGFAVLSFKGVDKTIEFVKRFIDI